MLPQMNAEKREIRTGFWPRMIANGHEFNPAQAHLPQRLKPHFSGPYRRPKGLLHPVFASGIDASQKG
jgi:hypothetical protein